MTATPVSLHAKWLSEATARDADLRLPLRPRVLAELRWKKVAPDCIVAVGGVRTEVFRGRDVSRLLPTVVASLDGRRTLAELAAALASVSASSLRGIVALLHTRGLLEDGSSTIALDADGSLAHFARFAHRGRTHAHRHDLAHTLSSTEIAIVGGPAGHDLARLLRAAGVENVHVVISRHALGEVDLVIPVLTADEPTTDVESWMVDLFARGVSLFPVAIEAGALVVGPRLARRRSLCWRCHRNDRNAVLTSAHAEWRPLALALAATRIAHVIAGVTSGLDDRISDRYAFGDGGALRHEQIVTSRTLGCAACGVPFVGAASEALSRAWSYHELTSHLARDLSSARDHQAHYASGAATATRPLPTPPLVAHEGVALAQGRLLDTPLFSRAATGALTAATIGDVLARAFGDTTTAGARRRLAPTGGSLESTDGWLVVWGVADIAPGVYFYDGRSHRLECVANGLDQSFLALAPRGVVPPPCAILGTVALGRLIAKYDTFCYRLGYLDSGVAAAYVQLAADAAGIDAFPMPIGHDVAVARAIGATFPHPRALPAFAFALGAPASFELGTASADDPEIARGSTLRATSNEIALRSLIVAARSPRLRVVAEAPVGHDTLRPLPIVRSLDAILESRRSHRHFGRSPVHPSDVAAVLRAARAAPVYVGATPWFAHYVEAVALVGSASPSLPTGAYALDVDGTLVARGEAFVERAVDACVIQLGLAAAPVTIVLVVDMARGINARGERGYRELLLAAGASVAAAWLAAEGLGLVGCASGGVIAEGIGALLGSSGPSSCPVVSFHFGYRADAAR